ncbi:protealysin inhibitor emfourin [Microseira wollei]|uniref:Uncharacterized protein n=1 Tax=Microseira wollei NIES-4236 TaxID=2530354 RepID=A0AAV3WGE1_9CYAN|nr:protealysin inhibitor emfourin [Microseira wollei]GET37419.1 hypothetical protein MiSe_21720 [Microseira wollei NIES-4236]
MKVTFRQSGGYAGLRMGCEFDTDSLPADEAARLGSLVEQSGIMQAQSGSNPTARDLLNYDLTVETSEGSHHVSFDDMTVPQGVAPLLEYLQERSHPVKRG